MTRHCHHLYRNHALVWPCPEPAAQTWFDGDNIGYSWCLFHEAEGREDALRRGIALRVAA